MSQVDLLARSRDFVRLVDQDEYAKYFRHLDRVFSFLITWYQKLVEGGNTEAAIVESFCQKLLYTVSMLRLKHLYSSDHPLALDLNDSGFPHSSSIRELESDLALLPERLGGLPSRPVVQEMMLEDMLRRGRDPVELLPQMSAIQFAEELDGNRSIFPFTPGELIPLNVTEGNHTRLISCLFSWLCYDARSNMPYVHVMVFDYQGSVSELTEEYERGEFLSVIRKYGNRVSPMAMLATSIDQDLPFVFPKVLKRVRIGPVICPYYTAANDRTGLVSWLMQYGELADFALELEAETIFSRGQVEQEESGWWSFATKKKQIQQIFAVSELDSEANDRQTSQIQRLLILPHDVLQQLGDETEFKKVSGLQAKVTYNREGGVYAV